MQFDDATANICLLGDLGIRVGDADALPRGRKARALIGVVAYCRDHRASREFLADLLWSDRGEIQARNSLRQALAEIKATSMGPAGLVTISREQVTLAALRVFTDIGLILAACAAKNFDALADALSTAGVFMVGFEGLAPAFDDWLRIERPRAHDLVVATVLQQGPAMLSAGLRAASVQTIIRALEKLDPLNEVVARLAMEVDFQAGDGASLHRRYRRLSRELEEEFGVQPAPETRSLFARLTSEALPPAPAPAKLEPTNPGLATPAHLAPPMVMVCPLGATDGDPVTLQIAAAASDDIRAALSRHVDIRVISLETLDKERVAAVCTGALAAYMLSGTVRQTEAGARVNLQLGNVSSSLVVWSDSLRVDRVSIDGFVERIVAKAVGAVMPAIDRDFATRMRVDQPEGVDPISLYAQARHLIRVVRSREAVTTGIGMLQKVITLDHGHVGARLLLAQLYNTDLWQQVTGHDYLSYRAQAMTLIQEAAAIEPENSRIQVKLSWCYLRRGDWAAAERRLKTAVAASPYDAEAINECALAFAHLGELETAEDLMQRAFLLNPFAPADYHADYALMLAMRGEAMMSEEHFEASGEDRLQYIAVRMANLSHVPDGQARRNRLRDEFISRFASSWQAQIPYKGEDLIAWFDQTYPFQRPGHRTFWIESFKMALG